MKKSYFILLIISMLFASCSVESSAGDSNSNAVIGTWTWQKSCGGIAGTTETPESTGVQQKLVFTKEGRMILYRNNVETGNYPYEIRVGKSIYSLNDHYLIYTENHLMYVILEIDSDDLVIGDDVFDGFVSSYKK